MFDGEKVKGLEQLALRLPLFYIEDNEGLHRGHTFFEKFFQKMVGW